MLASPIIFPASPDMLIDTNAAAYEAWGAFKTNVVPAIDPADLWDAELGSGSAVVGSPPESHSSCSANTDQSVLDDSDIDIDMQPVASGSYYAYTEALDEIVILAGHDNTTFKCSKTDIFNQSAVLHDMITVRDGQQRIDLALPYKEIKILAETLSATYARSTDYWEVIPLDEMVRAIELYVYYDFYEWDWYGIELAILDRLRRDEKESFAPSRFDLTDPKYTARLRGIAETQGMDRVLEVIDRAVPKSVSTAPYGDEKDERPRKWRKISAK